MGKAVEIRVHGVGGTPAEHLLGESSPDDVVRIAGSGESAFYRRTTDHSATVEGYAWGPLTSRPLLQPLWIVLLPFTLANVAGWMLPSRSEARREAWWKAARALILLLGVTLTFGYALGVSIVVVKQVFYQWGSTWSWWVFDWLGDRAGWRIAVGGVAAAALGALSAHMARRTQRGFEAVPGPLGTTRSPDDVGLFEFRLKDVPSRLGIDADFRDEEFWSRARRARVLLKWHTLAWLVAVAAFATIAAANAGPARPRAEIRTPVDLVRALPSAFGVTPRATELPELGLQGLFAWLGLVQAVLLTLLLAVLVLGFRRPKHNFVTGHFRVFGPCIAFSTAISLAAGFFSGLATVAGKQLQRLTPDDDVVPLGGPEFDLDIAFGAGALTFVVCGLLLLGGRLLHGRKIAQSIRATKDPPVADTGSSARPNGVPEHKVGNLGSMRALSLAIRNSDWVLSVPALPFALLATATLASMFGLTAHPQEWEIGPWLIWLDGAGAWLTAAGVTLLAGVLVRDYFKVKRRRTIGILWDVLTFWPRRFHPLAVRPYAERAVPELQCRVVAHLRSDRERSVIVSAHSQGSILAYAGLAQLTDKLPYLMKRVCLVTYGAPLTRLHSCFFPGYFDAAGFRRLERELCPGTVTIDGREQPMAWRNFYRLTDYIGQRVEFAEPPPGAPACELNVEVDDPASTPPDAPPENYERPDRLRPAWVELGMHSNYDSEIVMKDWKRALRAELEHEPPTLLARLACRRRRRRVERGSPERREDR